MLHDFKKLNVWEVAVDLATDVYSLTAKFPHEESFGLVSQMQRAAVSISSNIAEGAGRNSNKYFAQFLNYAYGSSCELETQIIIASKLTYINANESERILTNLNKIQKMIYKLINSITMKE